MATIIKPLYYAGDGYDMDVLLSTGTRHTFHFLTPPADVQVAVDTAETALLAVQDTTVQVVSENGVLING